MKLRVLVADDHQLMLDGIRRALEPVEDLEIVGEAHSGTEVLPAIARTDPDVVLLDMRMPGMDGLVCLERIRKRYPKIKVVVLSVFREPEHIEAALKRGASGYIVKSVNPLDLPAALRQAFEGTVYHALGIAETDDSDRPRGTSKLTEREVGILKAVARGLSNQAIGKELWVTEQTVKFHLTNIYRKLGVTNRTEAARYAYQHALVESPALELA
jgi:DNA-binding NarL/FixJ family response regulator